MRQRKPAAWGFTKSGIARGFTFTKKGQALPRFRAEDPAIPDPTAPAPAPPTAKSNVIYIYDFIGYDYWSGTGIGSDQVMQALEDIGADADVEVRINSPGGDVFEGIAIFNAIARHKGKVTVHIDALAASMASFIMLSGREVFIAENAMVMVHLPWSCACGNADDFRATAEILDKVWVSMAATYARRTGMTAAAIRKKVSDAPFGEWWMTAEDAVKFGFADSVEEPGQVAAMAEGAGFKAAPAGLAAVAVAEPPVRPTTAPAIEEPPAAADDEVLVAGIPASEDEFEIDCPRPAGAGAYPPRSS